VSAKDNYYKYLEDMKEIHKEGFRDVITDYVDELEAQNIELEKVIKKLKSSQSQKQKIKMFEKIEELEFQKKEALTLACNLHYELELFLKKHGIYQ